MKPFLALILLATLLVSLPAQEAPKATLVPEPAPPAPAAATPVAPAPPTTAPGSASSTPSVTPAAPAAPPAATVKTAMGVAPAASGDEDKLTIEALRKNETALKKKMMLVGMGSAVVGLLLGLMIGRATAPAPKFRRF